MQLDFDFFCNWYPISPIEDLDPKRPTPFTLLGLSLVIWKPISSQFPRNLAQFINKLNPRWWEHVKTRNLVLDGDMILLHQQEHFLQQKQPTQKWKTAYKLPTSAERFVIGSINILRDRSPGKKWELMPKKVGN